MRILIVGAGAIGGYFGGRLLEIGRDVTFLVRPQRAARLAQTGLSIASPFGNANLPGPATVTARDLREPYDVVLLSCKAYDLEPAIEDLAPAVGPNTALLPLLNGLRHLDLLDARFGPERVLGGTCFISTRLDDTGRIAHFSDVHQLTFGERDGRPTARVEAIATALHGVKFEWRASQQIVHEMWQKWVFLASLAGITCLMRAAIGDNVTAGGAELATALLAECAEIARAAGFPPSEEYLDISRARLTKPDSVITASMLGDIERGGRTEADHILGDLLRRRASVPAPDNSLLRVAYTALRCYDARRNREAAEPAP